MSQSLVHRRFIVGLAAPLMAMAIVGCAATGSASTPAGGDQAVLQKRAQAYWDLVRANDTVAAWAYEAASKDQTMTLEAYIKRGGIAYDVAEVKGVRSMEGSEAVLNVFMRYSVPLLRLKGQEATAPDHWRQIDGVWYHVIRRSSTMPDAQR